MKQNLLIITPTWPAPNYSAVGVRLIQLVRFFEEEDYKITIGSTADKAMVNASDFKGISLVSIRLNHSSFDEYIKELRPDVVLFDRFMTEEQFGWRITEHVPDALRVLDTEDLHSLRKSREEVLKKAGSWNRDHWLQHDMTKREVASMLRSDLSLIISSFEMELLKSVVPNHESLLVHLPFMMKPLSNAVLGEWPSFEERNDFVFIGFGGHAPNIDAIEHLKKDIWPLIRKELSKARITIYGGNLPKKIHQLHNPGEGFLIQGWAPDAKKAILGSKVMLAPLRFGAGLKGKLVSAMCCGTPSVTTRIGAEGMHEDFEWSGIIRNDPTLFAEAAVELYQNKDRWLQAQQNSIKIVNQCYDKKGLSIEFDQRLKSVQANLSGHRAKNFVGSILQHQTLASTKYMAKWIEQKNVKG